MHFTVYLALFVVVFIGTLILVAEKVQKKHNKK
jgi:hypothetical protein